MLCLSCLWYTIECIISLHKANICRILWILTAENNSSIWPYTVAFYILSAPWPGCTLSAYSLNMCLESLVWNYFCPRVSHSLVGKISMYTHIYYDVDKDYRRGKLKKKMRKQDRCRKLKVLCVSQALLRSQITSNYLVLDVVQRTCSNGRNVCSSA